MDSRQGNKAKVDALNCWRKILSHSRRRRKNDGALFFERTERPYLFEGGGGVGVTRQAKSVSHSQSG